MATRLAYVIKYVADMDKAIAFYRDTLGLPVKFATPGWTEMDTGDTTLALHVATPDSPAGTAEVGLRLDDLDAFHAGAAERGVTFTREPRLEHGTKLAAIRDCEGAQVSLSG